MKVVAGNFRVTDPGGDDPNPGGVDPDPDPALEKI